MVGSRSISRSCSTTALATVDLDAFLPAGGISSSQWREAVLPFSTLGLANCSFNELILQAATAANQPEVRVDDIRFVFDPTPPGTVAVTVDPALDRRPISDLVYGVNFATPAQLAAVGYTLNRWGGNRTTRYNWQLDVDNSANDWYFTNYAGDNDPQNLPADSAADQFLRRLARRRRRSRSDLADDRQSRRARSRAPVELLPGSLRSAARG